MVFGAQIRKPVPAKNAFDADNDVVQIRKDQFKKQLRVGFDVLVHDNLALGILDAHLHLMCMQINLAVVLVL